MTAQNVFKKHFHPHTFPRKLYNAFSQIQTFKHFTFNRFTGITNALLMHSIQSFEARGRSHTIFFTLFKT